MASDLVVLHLLVVSAALLVACWVPTGCLFFVLLVVYVVVFVVSVLPIASLPACSGLLASSLLSSTPTPTMLLYSLLGAPLPPISSYFHPSVSLSIVPSSSPCFPLLRLHRFLCLSITPPSLSMLLPSLSLSYAPNTRQFCLVSPSVADRCLQSDAVAVAHASLDLGLIRTALLTWV